MNRGNDFEVFKLTTYRAWFELIFIQRNSTVECLTKLFLLFEIGDQRVMNTKSCFFFFSFLNIIQTTALLLYSSIKLHRPWYVFHAVFS